MGALERFLEHRKTASTDKKTNEILDALPQNVRAHVFYSARVAEDHITARLRAISDAVSSGIMSVASARQELKRFLKNEGKLVEETPGTAPQKGTPEFDLFKKAKSLKNIGSTARLNLILAQNRLMANAVATYAEGMDKDIQERWPYWRYVSEKDGRSRPAHAALDGKIFKKSDPIWNTIFPPNGFNCRCHVEDVAIDEVDPKKVATPGQFKVQKDKIQQDVFTFNPKDAFSSYDLSRVKDPSIRKQLEAQMGSAEKIQKNFGIRLFADRVQNDRMQYLTAKELNLKPFKESTTPAPRKEKTDLKTAEDMLNRGSSVITADGREVVFGKEVLRHWKEDKKEPFLQTKKDRLPNVLNAIETIKHPDERWDTESGSLYIKRFDIPGRNVQLVSVKNNGEVNTFYPVNEKDVEKDRKGISYELFN